MNGCKYLGVVLNKRCSGRNDIREKSNRSCELSFIGQNNYKGN